MRQGQFGAGNGSKLANLERAAQYPWSDDGRCAVRESSGDWATLVERCFGALDLHRIRFVDHEGRCPIAQAGAMTADEVTQLVGICLLIQPEIAVGAVIVIGAVVVAVAISEAIDAERQKLPCKCMCMGVDGRGKTHGPYDNKRTKDRYACEQKCLQDGYAGGGFCR